jgi:large subunit ribosomal protein L6e
MVQNYLLRKSLMRYSAAARSRLCPSHKPIVKPIVKKAAEKPAKKASDKKKEALRVRVPSPRNVLPLTDRRKSIVRHFTPKTAKLRSSIKPGQVLILLAGRFRGKRVVFVKQLASGLLLVTGPFKMNGVPLRRVNQCHVIATSTRLDIASVKVDEKITDKTFSRPHVAPKRKSEAQFFKDGKDAKKAKKEEETKKKAAPAALVEMQKAMDSQLIPIVKKVPEMRAYLSARFGLTNNEYPHLMKF